MSNLFRKSATNSNSTLLVVNKVSAGGFVWQDAVKTFGNAAMDGGKADISKAVLRMESLAGAMYMGQPKQKCGKFLFAKRQSMEFIT